jgi:Cu(I)/Ag(I) efflux system membrane protein CusA/SilA
MPVIESTPSSAAGDSPPPSVGCDPQHHRLFADEIASSFYLFAAFLTALGAWSAQRTPLDALPDLSDTQVIIATEWMGRNPTLIEDQVTYPIATTFLGAPKVKTVRGFTMFGMSFVYVIFQDGTDLYWARSRVVEYLSKVREKLPPGANPQIWSRRHERRLGLPYALVDRSGSTTCRAS